MFKRTFKKTVSQPDGEASAGLAIRACVPLRRLQPALHDLLVAGILRSHPREYEESIRMDGAGSFRVLVSLIVPLSLPAIAVVSMFIFSGAWDEFPVAPTLLNSSGKFTLPIGLAYFIGVHTVAWGPFLAAVVIATIPVIVVSSSRFAGSDLGCHSVQFARSKSKEHDGVQSIDTDGSALGTTPWVCFGAADRRSW
jgi:ABC-type Fe3+ transport system permease subunit